MPFSLKFFLLIEGVTSIMLGIDWLLDFPFWPFVFGDLVVFIVAAVLIVRSLNRLLA